MRARLSSLAAVCIVVGCLVPFLGKAFHVDDPLFLWSARQIIARPGDFFGTTVNWLGTESPLSEVTLNPPLASYYAALVIALGGDGEVVLHSAFLVFPLLVVLGILALARQLEVDGPTAALAATLTPVFLVSSTNVMSDVMMLAFWVWAIDQWMRGVRETRAAPLVRGGVLAALALLTKYFAISLVPLLASYTLAAAAAGKRIRVRVWAPALAIPLLVLGLYELYTLALYGEPHFSSAMNYAQRARRFLGFSLPGSTLTGFAFAGGCAASALFFAPLVWSRRALVAWIAAGLLVGAGLATMPSVGIYRLKAEGSPAWLLIAQLAVFVTTGGSIFGLALADVWRRRDSTSVLLALWVLGTFVFAAFLNWSNNGRSNLPMLPAVGLLIARQLNSRAPGFRAPVAVALAASLVLAVAVTDADRDVANAAREAAKQAADRYGEDENPLWFTGHWGFQYYMQERGARAIDVKRSFLRPGDRVVYPSNNANRVALPKGSSRRIDVLEIAPPRQLTTIGAQVGAGFYSSGWGPLPFAFGEVPRRSARSTASRRRCASPWEVVSPSTSVSPGVRFFWPSPGPLRLTRIASTTAQMHRRSRSSFQADLTRSCMTFRRLPLVEAHRSA